VRCLPGSRCVDGVRSRSHCASPEHWHLGRLPGQSGIHTGRLGRPRCPNYRSETPEHESSEAGMTGRIQSRISWRPDVTRKGKSGGNNRGKEMTRWQTAPLQNCAGPDGGQESDQSPISFRHPTEEALPLASIIIPCHNSARYLSETIESALAQTHPDIEVILVDDGSTDETSSIAKSYPVRYVYQENRGISAARNKGISHCRGRYVQFLDHDDRLLPDAVETGVRLLEEHPECAIAVGEHRYIGADGRVLGYSNKRAAGRDLYLMLLEGNFVETPCSALHRRSTFSITGIFDENVQGAEDFELYLRTARRSGLIGHAAVVAEYRLHNANTSRNAGLMLAVSYRVLEMERPHLRHDHVKLRLWRRGMRSVERLYGRQLARELMHKGSLTTEEDRRKLRLLLRHYVVGFAAVILTRLLPSKLSTALIDWIMPNAQKRQSAEAHHRSA
jgi:glycosyltransferase involved in cell wall biosynthesis